MLTTVLCHIHKENIFFYFSKPEPKPEVKRNDVTDVKKKQEEEKLDRKVKKMVNY